MNIVFYLLIIFGFFGLIAIVGNKVPRLARLSEEELAFLERKKKLAEKYRQLNNHQYRINLMAGLEKLLRRVKILSLKTENLLSQWIKKIREKSLKLHQKSRQLIGQKSIKTKIWPKSLRGRIIHFPGGKKTESLKEEENQPIPEEASQISIADLEKPIKEEQQWIDLIIQNPKNIIAYKALGLLYFKQHNYADAKESLKAAVKLGSKDKKVREVLDELKKMEEQKKIEDERPA